MQKRKKKRKWLLSIFRTVMTKSPELASSVKALAHHFPTYDFSQCLWVHVGQQRLYLIKDSVEYDSWIISTATNGVGQAEGSYQTPQGLHQIDSKFGDSESLGMRFQARQATGDIVSISTDPLYRSSQDNITSRILWLDGLEQGFNTNSKKRFIYIHGTDEEGRLGVPASHGCIRMSNKDVIEVFEQVEVGCLVYISLVWL